MPHSPIGPTGRTVAANITRLRRGQDLTMRELADGIAAAGRPSAAHPETISRVEGGTHRVTVDDLVAFATALGVRPEQLLTPFECDRCDGAPAVGFTCRTCGTEGA